MIVGVGIDVGVSVGERERRAEDWGERERRLKEK